MPLNEVNQSFRYLKVMTLLAFIFLVLPIASGNGQEVQKQKENQGFDSEVDFEFLNKNIVVDVSFGDKGPFRFLLDTGIHPSVMTPEAAKTLGLKIGPVAGMVLGNGSKQIPYSLAKLRQLSIGELKIDSIEAIVADQSHLNFEDVELSGVLGYSFLKNRVTQIDFPNRKLRFSQTIPEPFLSNKKRDTDFVQFPMKLAGGKIPVIGNVKMNGRRFSAWLDTGCNGHVVLTRKTARKLRLEKQLANASTVTAVGSRGNFATRMVIAEKVAIGALRQDHLPVMVNERGGFDVVGNDFFDEYVLTLDYVNKQVFFEIVPEQQEYSIGIIIKPVDDRIAVEVVVPDSAAEKADLQTGDILLTANSDSLNVNSLNQLGELIAKGEPFSIVIQRGGKQLGKTLTPLLK